MPGLQPSKLERSLNLDFVSEKEKDNIWLTRQNTLRKLIGILGMFLPVLLWLTLVIDSGYTTPLYSISHYYFTRASSVFVIIVSLLAIFLLIYKGEGRADLILSFTAGLFALCLILFPTDNISGICHDPDNRVSLTILRDCDFRSHFHYISAAIFLGCLAALSLFVFTLSDKTVALRGRPKRRRNRIFRTCGVIMIVAILTILANFLNIIPDQVFKDYHLTFWLETIAVESFAISWLVKGEVILKDNH